MGPHIPRNKVLGESWEKLDGLAVLLREVGGHNTKDTRDIESRDVNEHSEDANINPVLVISVIQMLHSLLDVV